MSFIGNLLWIVLGGGLFIFLEYLLGGLILCLTIVGIPFGVQCIKLSVLGLFPFGRRIVDRPQSTGALSLVMNILWLLCGGIWLAVTHAAFGIILAVTIIGLPFAAQHLKLASLALVPFGKEIE